MKSDDDKAALVLLGEQLRSAREKAGLKQAEVANLARINPNYYSQMERGAVNSSFAMIGRACRVLGIRSLSLPTLSHPEDPAQ